MSHAEGKKTISSSFGAVQIPNLVVSSGFATTELSFFGEVKIANLPLQNRYFWFFFLDIYNSGSIITNAVDNMKLLHPASQAQTIEVRVSTARDLLYQLASNSKSDSSER